MYQQQAPYAVQVEPTEGCNLRCTFCGLNGIRGPNVRETDRYMTVATAQRLASEMARLGWNPRIEFAMHGEPTLNPILHLLFAAFRAYLPTQQLMLTTNGVPLQKHALGFDTAVDRLFANGLNVLALDDYAGLKVAPLARAYGQSRNIPMYEYPADATASPHTRRPVGSQCIIVVADIAVTATGTHSVLNNHAGGGAPLNNRAQGKRCAKPFRELAVRWDGSVAICCNTFEGTYRIGNINALPLDAVWQHPAFNAARKYLVQGKRVFAPCQGCDALSYRVGLLPDAKGVVTLPEPTSEDDAIIAAALADGPYTAPVLRPWEKDGSGRGRALPVL